MNLFKLYKTLTILTITALGALSLQAQATETRGLTPVKATIMVDTWNDVGTRIYYDCDYAKRTTKKMLQKMGAEDIKVRCSGGIDQFSHMFPTPVTLRVEFKALDKNGRGAYETESRGFKIKYSDDCHLPSTVFKKLLPNFEISNEKYTSRCTANRFARFEATGFVPVLK